MITKMKDWRKLKPYRVMLTNSFQPILVFNLEVLMFSFGPVDSTSTEVAQLIVGFKSKDCLQELQSLIGDYMNGLQKVDLMFLTSQQKLAFWVNMYNVCDMHGPEDWNELTTSDHEALILEQTHS
ncbi:hypothetical protein L6452_21412 [Arctium lappa]|uniref:Uncharacterized protein n=1 Tax=Arctium lappa TaxID=4217 RepID=A0ACB9AXM8_ARCLA|nr:hypothetical protein L6452_21412 [Arctium lappa]